MSDKIKIFVAVAQQDFQGVEMFYVNCSYSLLSNIWMQYSFSHSGRQADLSFNS